MNSSSTRRRDFLQHAGLMGSIAMMFPFSQSAIALDGGAGGIAKPALHGFRSLMRKALKSAI